MSVISFNPESTQKIKSRQHEHDIFKQAPTTYFIPLQRKDAQF